MTKIRIRPYSDSDYEKLSKGMFITNSGNAAYASASSSSIFGAQGNVANKETKMKSSDTFHLPGIIQLAIPVPNFFLCHKNLLLLKRVLRPYIFTDQLSRNINVESIMDCTYIYSKSRDLFINVATELGDYSYYDGRDFLIGGQCLKYFMSKLDVEEEIEREISIYVVQVGGVVARRIGVRAYRGAFECFDIYHGADQLGDVHVVDDYFIKYKEWVSKSGKKSCNISEHEDILEEIRREFNVNVYPRINKDRISYLLQLRDKHYMNNFMNLIQSYVAVLPIGFRKGIDGEQSPITKAYNNLIRINENLKSVMRQGNVDTMKVITMYKELVRQVKYVVADSSIIKSSATGYKSLIETTTGKHGLIREHMQSSIVDNTGRTVIIGNTNMSIDSVGIPYRILREVCDVFYIEFLNESTKGCTGNRVLTAKDKLKKLKEFKADENFKKTKEFIDKLCDTPDCKHDYVYSILRNICPVFMMPVGRQPTLWKYGIQAFKVVPVDGMAIQLAPLCVVAFNADFDGDQMHTSVAVSLEAQYDLVNKMANTKNIYLSRDGSCHIFPRHEIMYGLWYASLARPVGEVVINAPKLSVELKDEILNMVKNNEAPLESKVIIGGFEWSLGQMAVKCCAGVRFADYIIGDMHLRKANVLFTNSSTSAKNTDLKDGVCTDKWCKALLTLIYDEAASGERVFVETINNYTVVGTRIASHYPMDISLMEIPDVSRYVEEFEQNIKKSQRYYNLGLETYDGYSRAYAEAYGDMISKVKKDLMSNKNSSIYLGDDNGYKLMKDSGCRGSDSTLVQMFGLKGRMQRNSNETFNAIVKNSMSHGLTGLEHMVCAYGGRQGQIDKSLETSTPGYIYRILNHCMCNMLITEYDCNTTNGLLLDWDFLEFTVGNGNLQDDLLYDKIKELFYSIVIGRYLIEKPDGEVTKYNSEEEYGIFESMVAEFKDDGNGHQYINKKAGVHLRSPITCNNPCCQKCYGIDLSKHKKPIVGHAIGLEASQSISEPLSQLILKNFQKGGVAQEGGLASAFDLISAYIELRTVDKCKKGAPRFYDVISPYTGEVEYNDIGNGIRHVFIKENGIRQNHEPYVMYNNVALKSYVSRGEGIMLESGNFVLDEITDIMGIDYTIRYLAVKLWQIFNDQDVNIKHFETLVASMIYYVCVRTVGNFKSSKAYSLIEYRKNVIDEAIPYLKKTLYSVKEVPEMSNDVLRGVMFEQQVRAISSHILKNDEDSLEDVYVRASLGLSLDNIN